MGNKISEDCIDVYLGLMIGSVIKVNLLQPSKPLACWNFDSQILKSNISNSVDRVFVFEDLKLMVVQYGWMVVEYLLDDGPDPEMGDYFIPVFLNLDEFFCSEDPSKKLVEKLEECNF